MIKTILATAILTVAMASGASAASMKKMDNMKKMDHSMAMKKHKCDKGMMMMHGKCVVDHKMKMMKKK
jgi:hypothetical protein